MEREQLLMSGLGEPGLGTIIVSTPLSSAPEIAQVFSQLSA